MRKRINVLFFIGLIGTVLLSQSGVSAGNSDTKPVSGKFRTQLDSVVKSYLQVKDALGQSSFKQAAKSAQQLKKSLAAVDSKLLAKMKQKEWQKRAALLRQNTEKIAKTPDLKTQRAAFSELSKQIGILAKEYGPLSVTLYRQYCPMAFNKKGGKWLSDSKEILNPYLGADMPKCGQVIETIRAGK